MMNHIANYLNFVDQRRLKLDNKFMCLKVMVIFSLLTLPVLGDETLPSLKIGNNLYTNVTVTKVTVADIYFTSSGVMGNAKLKDLDPEIIGSLAFSNQVSQAMQLLQARDGDAYAMVRHCIGRIQESESRGTQAYATPPAIGLSDDSTFYSLTWCAAVIAHDSLHSKQYHDDLKTHDNPIPAGVWTGAKAEQQCMAYQLQVMEQIGATRHEMDWEKKQLQANNP